MKRQRLQARLKVLQRRLLKRQKPRLKKRRSARRKSQPVRWRVRRSLLKEGQRRQLGSQSRQGGKRKVKQQRMKKQRNSRKRKVCLASLDTYRDASFKAQACQCLLCMHSTILK